MHVEAAYVRKSLQWLGLVATVCGFPAAALGAGAQVQQPTYSFNLPAQPLGESLRQVGQQTSTNILFDPQIVLNMIASAVHARLTVSQVIGRLLQGTKLGAKQYAADTILVRQQSDIQGKNTSRAGPVTDDRNGGRLSQAADDPPVGTSEDGRPQLSSGMVREALQEVIVTAQKYRQRALDVPISLVVLESEELQQRGIDSPEDLQFAVPGLTVQGGNFQRRMTLRGIGNVFGSGGMVGEYVNDADVTPMSTFASFGFGVIDARMYDLQRVEVLRGPQGTLFGVGAMGGAIRLITQKPVLDQFQMSSDVAATFTQSGAPGQRIEAMLNTPIVADTLGFRMAAEFEQGGGWVDQPAANLKDINGQHLVDVRIEGLWQVTQKFNAYVMQIIHRNAFGASAGEDENGNITQSFDLSLTPRDEEKSNITNVTLTYDLDRMQLLSSTTYFTHGYSGINLGNYYQDLGELYVYVPLETWREEDASEELRLTRTGPSPWKWTVGGFYKHFRDAIGLPDGEYVGVAQPPGSPPPGPLLSGYGGRDTSNSWSAFGDTSYKFFDRLTVGMGVRYFKDQESSDNSLSSLQKSDFTSTDPRFYAQYEVSHEINTYVSAAKGFRSGGFNSLGQPPFNPESLWSYELGTKARLLDRHLSSDTAVFYSNYSNYVVLGLVPGPFGVPFNIYSNAGLVRIKGVDESLTWLPVADWRLSISGELLSARFVALNVLSSVYHAGETVDLVPRYSFTASIEREFRLASRPGYARLDYSQVGRERDAAVANYLDESDVIHMLNVSSGIQYNEYLTLGFFAQNLLNDRGHLNPFKFEGFADRPRPRTYGISFGVKF